MRHIIEELYGNESGSIGASGIDELRWPVAVRPGDTLRVEAEVISTRPSRTKPDRGILHVATKVFNQNDEVVMTWVSVELIKRRNRGSPPTG